MRNRIFILLAALAALLWARFHFGEKSGIIAAPKFSPAEEEPACPWREPERDMAFFFPEATGRRQEARPLSAKRLALQQVLGRQPGGADQLLRINWIEKNGAVVGAILLKRVKGEHGAIELVIAKSLDGTLRGVRAQRCREPDAVASAFEPLGWISCFQGKSATNRLALGGDLPMPPAGQDSARAVAEGVKLSLAVFALAQDQTTEYRAHAH